MNLYTLQKCFYIKKSFKKALEKGKKKGKTTRTEACHEGYW